MCHFSFPSRHLSGMTAAILAVSYPKDSTVIYFILLVRFSGPVLPLVHFLCKTWSSQRTIIVSCPLVLQVLHEPSIRTVIYVCHEWMNKWTIIIIISRQCYEFQTGLELMIFLLQPPKCWDYRHVLQYLPTIASWLLWVKVYDRKIHLNSLIFFGQDPLPDQKT